MPAAVLGESDALRIVFDHVVHGIIAQSNLYGDLAVMPDQILLEQAALQMEQSSFEDDETVVATHAEAVAPTKLDQEHC